MAFEDTLSRLERLAYLVHRKATGTPQQLADKMEVSLRTVDNLVNCLRAFSDVEILYCRDRRSYCFSRPVKINFEFIIPLDSDNEIRGEERNVIEVSEDADFVHLGFLPL